VSARAPEPPSGEPAPVTASVGTGAPIDLVALAEEVCRRYRGEFPDESGRYGEAGNAWCVHDNQYLLSWAAEAAGGFVDMHREVAWLARVLEARDFPLERLARNLDLGAEVTGEQLPRPVGEPLAAVLADAAVFVRSRVTFLD
jgi:hypothetical protein